LYAHADLALNRFGVFLKLAGAGYLKGATAGENTFILDGVRYSAETITDGILELCNGVLVWPLD